MRTHDKDIIETKFLLLLEESRAIKDENVIAILKEKIKKLEEWNQFFGTHDGHQYIHHI